MKIQKLSSLTKAVHNSLFTHMCGHTQVWLGHSYTFGFFISEHMTLGVYIKTSYKQCDQIYITVELL